MTDIDDQPEYSFTAGDTEAYSAPISAGGSVYDILIIGAGFCGSVLSGALVESLKKPALIAVLDKFPHGPGENFRGRNPVLTVPERVKELSGSLSRPDDFLKWLQEDAGAKALYDCGLKHDAFGAESFPPRRVYGEYLARVLRNAHFGAGAVGARLDLFRCEATEIRKDPESEGLFYVKTAENEILRAKKIVLALGAEAPVRLPFDFPSVIQNGRGFDFKPAIDEIKKDERKNNAPIIVYGEGAPAADAIIGLRLGGYEGLIIQFPSDTPLSGADFPSVSPEIENFLQSQISAGSLRVANARFYDASEYEGGLLVRSEGKAGKLFEYQPALLVNAAPAETRLTRAQNPLTQSLVTFGAALPHASGNGAATLGYFNLAGVFAETPFFVIGALTVGAFPDISTKELRDKIRILRDMLIEPEG